jgi:hypothetical protein
MKIIPKKYYHKDEINCHCFFQPAPAANLVEKTLEGTKQIDSLPDPLDRYRIPRLRLVPHGYK